MTTKYTFAHKGCPNVIADSSEPKPGHTIFDQPGGNPAYLPKYRAHEYMKFYRDRLGDVVEIPDAPDDKNFNFTVANKVDDQIMNRFKTMKRRYNDAIDRINNPHHVLGYLASFALDDDDQEYFLERLDANDQDIVDTITRGIPELKLPEEII